MKRTHELTGQQQAAARVKVKATTSSSHLLTSPVERSLEKPAASQVASATQTSGRTPVRPKPRTMTVAERWQRHEQCPAEIRERGPHIGLYCAQHHKWIKWVSLAEAQELRQADIPWIIGPK